MANDLFSIINPKLFVPLSSRYQRTYLEALTILREEVEISGSIEKQYYHNILQERLKSVMQDQAFAEDDEISDDSMQKLSDNAYRIIKRLESTGWIYIQYDEKAYDEKLILREHGRIILEAIDKILDLDKSNYKGINFQIYSQLNTANEKKRSLMYTSLAKAVGEAERYREWLVNKSANIKGEYLRRILNKEMSVKEIADEFLDKYTEEISKAILEPIKTYDSPTTYKPDIMEIVSDWELYRYEELLEQCAKANPDLDEDGVRLKLSGYFHRIYDVYSSIPKIIENIIEDDTLYSQKAIAKMRYIGTADSGARGVLIRALNDSKEDSELGDMMRSVIKLHSASPLSSTAILNVPSVRVKDSSKASEPLLKNKMSDDDLKALFDKIKSSHITQDMINDFVIRQLGGEKQASNATFRLFGERDFMLLILSEAKCGSKKSVYDIDFSPFLERNSFVEISGHRVPELIYRRK